MFTYYVSKKGEGGGSQNAYASIRIKTIIVLSSQPYRGSMYGGLEKSSKVPYVTSECSLI